MKIATGNRINEFWEELKEVLVPRSNVLKTIEEIEANTNEENIAGATALKAVNNNLMSRPEFITDENGKITGYKTPGGADTVFPFNNNKLEVVKTGSWITQKNYTEKYTADKDATYIIFMCCAALGSNAYTFSVTSSTANVNTIVNDVGNNGARAAFTVKLKKGESISIYFNTGSINAYNFSTLIIRN